MLRLPELFVVFSHVVYWLGSGALTAMARVHFPAWELKIFKCAFPFTLNFPRDGFPFFHQDHSQFPVLKIRV